MQDKASVGMTTQPIAVRESMGEDVSYQFNGDPCAERCKGENRGIGGGPYADVEVSGRGQELLTDPIEAAIESLMVVRDALRKLADGMIPPELLNGDSGLDTNCQTELLALLGELREEQRAAKRAEGAMA